MSEVENQLKIALPKGRFLDETASLLDRADWGLDGYHGEAPVYRLESRRFPNLLAKIFHEKDIPVQVAVGNYDLGICGLDWIEELLAKYPSSALLKLRDLAYGRSALYVVTSSSQAVSDRLAGRSKMQTILKAMQVQGKVIRLASEYPNLAELFALNQRLRRFSVYPLWGAAEAYPPDSADLALISAGLDPTTISDDLEVLTNVLKVSACLIVNRDSWANKDLSDILTSIDSLPVAERENSTLTVTGTGFGSGQRVVIEESADTVRLALPDGHQQKPTLELLIKAGIGVDDYPSATGNRRPTISLEGVSIKVIRPQDMPLQVANGNFDIAVTGQDWLREHLYQFPSSPVTEILDLKSAKIRMVVVVSNDLPVEDSAGLRQLCAGRETPLRVASEYVNIADKYARENHLGMYRVIPTWGATEAFLPEDADLLIENTETGGTIARHNLKIIDTIFESTGCLVGNKTSLADPAKAERIKAITEKLRAVV